MDGQRRPVPRPPRSRVEVSVAVALFVIAFVNFLLLVMRSGDWRNAPSTAGRVWFALPAAAFFALLAGAYLGLTISRVRLRVARTVSSGAIGPFLPPFVLFAAIFLYACASGVPSAQSLAVYAAYLFVPVAIVLSAGGTPVCALLAAAVLWLPLEFRLLPPILLPTPAGAYDASHLVGLVNGLCLFLATRPLGAIGFTFLLDGTDVKRAVAAFALFAVVALPIGLGTGFLTWHPNARPATILGLPWLILLGTAIPEEFLFRGVVQNACTRIAGPARGLAITSVVFGLAHLPDWRYAMLATLAGVAYGWVYARSGKITASAITHTLVDWVWVVLLRR